MNQHTKDFLSKLSLLLEEYKANIEIEGDAYSGTVYMTLEVLNPKTFDEHYDQWHVEHPGEKYDFDKIKYSYADWVDLGYRYDADKLKEILK